jgi:DNA-binding IclR family transcriptional regulator
LLEVAIPIAFVQLFARLHGVDHRFLHAVAPDGRIDILRQSGEAAGTQFDLRTRAEPYLIRLRDEFKETAVLAVPINGRPMVIAAADNIYARITISVKPGNRPVPHCSALDRLMAFSSLALQNELLAAPLPPETPLSMVSPEQLRERLAMLYEQFYEFSDGEVMFGVNTVAVPIFRDGDVLAGALSIVGSIQNIPNPPFRKQVDVLHACAAELSAQLNSSFAVRRTTC